MSGKKRGRPAKAICREVRAAVRLTQAEYFIVREKAADAGMSLSDYLRLAAFRTVIKARMTEEERLVFRQLVGMAVNLNQMVKACHQQGVLTAMAYFEQYRLQLDFLIKKLHHGQ